MLGTGNWKLGTGALCTFKQIQTRFALKLNVFTLHSQAKTIYDCYTSSVGRTQPCRRLSYLHLAEEQHHRILEPHDTTHIYCTFSFIWESAPFRAPFNAARMGGCFISRQMLLLFPTDGINRFQNNRQLIVSCRLCYIMERKTLNMSD